jgi:hypothetical protein
VNNQERSLIRIYEAFNRRDVDTVLAAMHSGVDWPNGWEGGRVTGHDEVRSYWSRQWAVLDPNVVPISFEHKPMAESPSAYTRLSEIYPATCWTMARSHTSIPSKVD